MTRRSPLAWIAPALAGALLSGCTSSSGDTTEGTGATRVTEGATPHQEATGRDGSGARATDRKAAQPAPSAPHVSALCDSLTAVYLTNISDAESAAGIVEDWVKVTADAPEALKDDLTIVGAYLVAAAKGDYPRLKAASDEVGEALDHVDRYVTRVCRA